MHDGIDHTQTSRRFFWKVGLLYTLRYERESSQKWNFLKNLILSSEKWSFLNWSGNQRGLRTSVIFWHINKVCIKGIQTHYYTPYKDKNSQRTTFLISLQKSHFCPKIHFGWQFSKIYDKFSRKNAFFPKNVIFGETLKSFFSVNFTF